MNINPKKSWHVRNKDNVAKMRLDEANALNEQHEEQRRIDTAESEFRLHVLRNRAGQNIDLSEENAKIIKNKEKLSHVNFFEDEEKGIKPTNLKNVENEAEKKDEQESYEKKIGYLNVLGKLNKDNPDLSEPWFLESAKLRLSDKSVEDCVIVEADRKRKYYYDPINDIKRGTSSPKDQQPPKKKQAQDVSGGAKSIDTMRSDRLRRERQESLRVLKLMAQRSGAPMPTVDTVQYDDRKRPYNSQFNPHNTR